MIVPYVVDCLLSRNPFRHRRFRFLQWLADDIYQGWFRCAERFFSPFAEIVGFSDPPALDAESVGDRGMIGDREIHGEVALAVS